MTILFVLPLLPLAIALDLDFGFGLVFAFVFLIVFRFPLLEFLCSSVLKILPGASL